MGTSDLQPSRTEGVDHLQTNYGLLASEVEAVLWD